MKILIVDDELSARKLLTGMLTDIFCDSSKSLELQEAVCLKDAVKVIKTFTPDLVLLDIEMPENSGLEILDFFKDQTIFFQLVFVTAYSNYAIEAFKLNAIDYLLKPIDILELRRVVEKVSKESVNILQNKIEDLRKSFLTNKIALEIPNGFMFISPDDIIILVADGMYTIVYTSDRKKTIVAKPIKYFINQLNHLNFFYRPHRSYFINLKYLKELSKKDGTTITLENGMSIPLSRDKKDEFISIVKDFF